MNNFLHPRIFIHSSISNQSFRALWRVFLIIPWFFVVFIAAPSLRPRTHPSVQTPAWYCLPLFLYLYNKNARLTPFDAQRSKPTKTEKSSRFRLLSAPMWHRTRAWLFLYIYFIFISLSSDNTTVFPFYPALSRSFPYTPLCDMECAPPHLSARSGTRTLRLMICSNGQKKWSRGSRQCECWEPRLFCIGGLLGGYGK